MSNVVDAVHMAENISLLIVFDMKSQASTLKFLASPPDGVYKIRRNLCPSFESWLV